MDLDSSKLQNPPSPSPHTFVLPLQRTKALWANKQRDKVTYKNVHPKDTQGTPKGLLSIDTGVRQKVGLKAKG